MDRHAATHDQATHSSTHSASLCAKCTRRLVSTSRRIARRPRVSERNGAGVGSRRPRNRPTLGGRLYVPASCWTDRAPPGCAPGSVPSPCEHTPATLFSFATTAVDRRDEVRPPALPPPFSRCRPGKTGRTRPRVVVIATASPKTPVPGLLDRRTECTLTHFNVASAPGWALTRQWSRPSSASEGDTDRFKPVHHHRSCPRLCRVPLPKTGDTHG